MSSGLVPNQIGRESGAAYGDVSLHPRVTTDASPSIRRDYHYAYGASPKWARDVVSRNEGVTLAEWRRRSIA